MPGAYELVVTPALGKAHVIDVSLGRGDRREIEFAFSLASVSGVVLRRTEGTPLAGLPASLAPEMGSGQLAGETDENGAFSFTGLVPADTGWCSAETPPTAPAREVRFCARGGADALRVVYPEGN